MGQGSRTLRKLIIQIPCYNEEQTLRVTLADLPRRVEGFDIVEWLVVDDGSTDRTVAVARECGVDHIISLRHNQGLARAFMAGLHASLVRGAHVIVNTDADNQYAAECIPDIVRPILEGQSDFVIGARPISEIEHFSPVKKILQRLGSWAVRVASGTEIPDAPSGFRAIHWEAAIHLNVFSNYTYTLETLIQAGRKNIRVMSVPVRVNEQLRPSRLIRSIPSYVRRSVITIFRIFLLYKPFRAFLILGLVLGFSFLLIGARFLYYLTLGQGDGHVQSLILAAILAVGSFISFSLAALSDLIAVNRTLLEEVRGRMLRSEIEAAQERGVPATAPPTQVRSQSD